MPPMSSAPGRGVVAVATGVAASGAPVKTLSQRNSIRLWEATGEAEGGRTPGYSRRRIKTGLRTRAGDTLPRHRWCGGMI
jgi:hypothetical protein